MPTYKNNTNLRPLLDGRVVEPKAIAYSLVYYDEDAIGLRLIDDKPFFNPIIMSKIITKPGEILIPDKDNLYKNVVKYSIHLYVEKGLIHIFYNSIENSPPLILATGSRWNTRHFQREINKLIINSDSDFTLFATVEKLP